MANYCSNCGDELDQSKRYCSNCGTKSSPTAVAAVRNERTKSETPFSLARGLMLFSSLFAVAIGASLLFAVFAPASSEGESRLSANPNEVAEAIVDDNDALLRYEDGEIVWEDPAFRGYRLACNALREPHWPPTGLTDMSTQQLSAELTNRANWIERTLIPGIDEFAGVENRQLFDAYSRVLISVRGEASWIHSWAGAVIDYPTGWYEWGTEYFNYAEERSDACYQLMDVALPYFEFDG